MSAQSHPSSTSKPVGDAPAVTIPSDLLVALLTPPLLLGVLGGKAVGDLLTSIGQASEEVFRGDRLPILNFPHQQ